MFWANASSNIADAYARFAGVIDEIEKTVVPKQTQETITQYISEGLTKKSEFGPKWHKEATKEMDPQSRTATTLALLTIFAPYQITRDTINDFRMYFPQQNQLLGVISWASFTKARKIGKLLNTQ